MIFLGLRSSKIWKCSIQLEHRFLTGDPWTQRGLWRASRGSMKIIKVKYCTHSSPFYKNSDVHQLLTLWGSVENCLSFRGPRIKKRLRTTELESFAVCYFFRKKRPIHKKFHLFLIDFQWNDDRSGHSILRLSINSNRWSLKSLGYCRKEMALKK